MKEHLEELINSNCDAGKRIRKVLLSGICALTVSWSMRSYGYDDLDLPIDPRAVQNVVERTLPPPQQIVEEPPTLFGEEIYGAEQTIIYVVDISGSMNMVMGTGVDLQGELINMTRFQTAQVELKRSIAALAQNFRFNIVAYNCSVFAWQRELMAATPENKTEAYNWIDTLHPINGAGTGTGMGVAYALRSAQENRDVVLLTDGDPDCRLTISEHRRMIQLSNPGGKRIHVFGIDTFGPFREFCIQVASDSGGSYHEIR